MIRERIQRSDLLRHRVPQGRADTAERVGPEGSILALAGGSSWEELQPVIGATFGNWQGGSKPVPAPEIAPQGVHHVPAETSQVQIGLAFPGPAQGTDAAYVYTVALNVLSGTMGSRLFTEVREKRGLVYSVFSEGTWSVGICRRVVMVKASPSRRTSWEESRAPEAAILRRTNSSSPSMAATVCTSAG